MNALLASVLAADVSPSSAFPGGALLKTILGYLLFAALVAAIGSVIVGLGTLGICRMGHGGASAHNWGGKLLMGGIVGLIGLIAINTIIGGVVL